jgi:hypothetical protein
MLELIIINYNMYGLICNKYIIYNCATLFRALRTAAGGDGMRKKDTEIQPEHAL